MIGGQDRDAALAGRRSNLGAVSKGNWREVEAARSQQFENRPIGDRSERDGDA